jgi:glycosyltransferase involved in cell wall biosynthesis
MPKVSVLLGSSRPGGVDISLLGLCAQTFDDFEVIFVDGRYHKRHAEVLDLVVASGLKQPFFHVPNHRYGEGPWTTISAGFNTGFMLATGEIVLMLCDYAYAPPGWIEAHLAHHTEPRMVVAPHRYRAMPPFADCFGIRQFVAGASLQDVVAQWTEFAELSDEPMRAEQVLACLVEPENDSKLSMPTGPVDHLYMHTKNESFPLESVLGIGGCDENYDRGRGPGDHDLGRRLIASGLQGWLASDALIEVVNPRGVMPNPNISLGDADQGERWGITQGNDYYHHTANVRVANNPYDLQKRRKNIIHWRELSSLREALIEPWRVRDSEYFKECPIKWPL